MARQKCTVLAIDDDLGDAEILRCQLCDIPTLEIEFVHHADAAAGAIALSQLEIDVIILDFHLGRQTGLEIIEAIRGTGDIRPLIVLTGNGDETLVASLMRGGADDYLCKDGMTPEALRRAITNARSQYMQRQGRERNRLLVEELRVAGDLLEKKNIRLAELYRTAHQFVDNVSHEFRTPLTVIKEFTSIVRDGLAGDVTDEQREYLGIVNNRVDDLSIMVDDMLDISKLEAGAMGVYRRTCRIEEIIEHVRTTLERKAAANQISLEFSIEPGLPELYCDPEKIQRIIINLTVNALKFSNEGGVVKLWGRSHADGSQIEVGVTDTGAGIAPENVEAIFERFKQVEGNIRSSTRGFGLGLNIAKELVHVNFGDISIESELGKGSTFSFTIPTSDPSPLLTRYLERIEHFRNGSTVVSLLSAHVDERTPSAVMEEVGELLQLQMRRSDLSFRIKPNTWLIVAAGNQQELESMINRVQAAWTEASRNRPDAAIPLIDLVSMDTWRVKTQRLDFIARFMAEYGAREPCPA